MASLRPELPPNNGSAASTGSIAAAAYGLGISETTARQHLSGLYRRAGCLNAAQAAFWLGTRRLGGDATLRTAPAPSSSR